MYLDTRKYTERIWLKFGIGILDEKILASHEIYGNPNFTRAELEDAGNS